MISAHTYLQKLIASGLTIDVVYDIGAWHGRWSTMFKGILPNARFILFEGSPFYTDSLRALEFEHYIDLLSDEVGRVVEFYDSSQSGESYYKENTIWNDGKHPRIVRTNTIDNLVATHNLPQPDFIKLDTQGAELDILRGASTVLPGAKVVVCEMPIIEYNLGAPTATQYLQFFDEAGFYPMHVTEEHHLDNVLVQIDVIFVRKDIKNQLLGANTQLHI